MFRCMEQLLYKEYLKRLRLHFVEQKAGGGEEYDCSLQNQEGDG